MAPRHIIKPWNEGGEALLSFYHFHLCHPEREESTFGSDREMG